MSPGSTIFFAPDPSVLVEIAELAADPDDADALFEVIDELPHVDLARLVALDFAQLVPAPHRWSHPAPIVFDEEGGLAIAGIEAGALEALLQAEPALEVAPEERDDLVLLRDFVAQHGLEHLYEVSTF